MTDHRNNPLVRLLIHQSSDHWSTKHHFFLRGTHYLMMTVVTPGTTIGQPISAGRGTEGPDCLGRNFYKCRRVHGWTR